MNSEESKTVYVPVIAPLVVDYDGAVVMLAVSKRTIEKMVADGKLPVLRVGALVRFPVEGLQMWIEQESRYESAFVSETLYARKRRTGAQEGRQGGRPRSGLSLVQD